jgi:signal transduction histidine kinase
MLIDRALRLDPTKIAQVFVSVLSNAIKFTPAGGSVEIDSDLNPDGGISVWFRDTGAGIAPEDVERVLQPFAQAEDHLTRQHGGLGLGLPISRALMRMHDGDLLLTSQVGNGTTVEIRLPPARVQPFAA